MKKKDMLFWVDVTSVKPRHLENGKIDYYINYYVLGVRRQISRQTEEEVLEAVYQLRKEIEENGEPLRDSNIKVSGIISAIKKDMKIKDGFQSNSILAKTGSLNRIEAAWGDLDVRKIDEELIKKFLDEEYTLEMSSSTVKKEITEIKEIIRYAKIKKLIPKNHDPFGLLKVKDLLPNKSEEKKAIPFFEREKYLEMFKTSNYYVFLMLLYKTAMRFSEAAALTAKDIEIDPKSEKRQYLLNVNKQIQYNKRFKNDRGTTNFLNYLYKNTEEVKEEGQLVFKVLKTKSKMGTRKILISAETADMLFKYIEENKEKIDNSAKNSNLKLIFLNSEGKAYLNGLVNLHLASKCAKHDLEIITCHTFRRTAITRFFENNLTFQEVMSIAGHSTKEMTQIYNKVSHDFMQNNPDRIRRMT